MKNKRISYNSSQFKEFIKFKNPNVEILSDYKGWDVPVKIKYTNCGHIYEDYSRNIQRNRGCCICNYRIIEHGINDLWISAPDVAKYLEDPDDSLYAPYSREKTWFKCNDCGFRKYTSINNINRFGIGCPCCRDGFSQGEKTMMYILNVNNIDYETQKVFEWSNRKKYDFYLKQYSLIIEVQGGQHYDGVNMFSGRDEIENDNVKYQYAISNGIKNYIYIDYSTATVDYLINSVENSPLMSILNLDMSLINRKDCLLYTATSFKKECWKLWNEGLSTKQIAEKLHMATNSLCAYLREGNKYKIVNYNGQEERNKASYHKVICLNSGEVFDGISVAQKKYGINNIAANCLGTIKSAGIDLNTGDPLVWMYYEDYLLNGAKEYYSKTDRKVVCLNNNYLFKKMITAAKWAGLKNQTSINQYLRRDGNHEYAGKHPKTGEKLRWMYYDDYIKKFDESTLIEYQGA